VYTLRNGRWHFQTDQQAQAQQQPQQQQQAQQPQQRRGFFDWLEDTINDFIDGL
jgi:hypothetical protein